MERGPKTQTKPLSSLGVEPDEMMKKKKVNGSRENARNQSVERELNGSEKLRRRRWQTAAEMTDYKPSIRAVFDLVKCPFFGPRQIR
jgi:hypothetical protein